MKKWTLALTAAAIGISVAAAGVVYAEQTGAMPPMADMHHPMRADPLGDATITRADAEAKAAALFAQLDLNHDGKLDPADRAVRIGEHFDKMDANHDGVLSKQEFIAAHEQAMAGHEGHDGPDHEGVGPDGLGQSAMGHAGMGPGMMGHRMMGMDADGNRAVTRAEFIADALKRFDEADANHDGKLTKDERRATMRAHMRQMREMMGGMPGMMPPPGGGGDPMMGSPD